MPISGCHDLPLATFNLPSRNRSQSNRKIIPQNKNLLACPAAGRGAVSPERVKQSPLNQKPLVPSLCGGMRV